MNKKKEIEYQGFEVEDVYDIKNPAYVVGKVEIKDKNGKIVYDENGKIKYGGCIVSWNEEFERLTNFEPKEIDNNHCHDLFDGCQQTDGKSYVHVCGPNCKYYKNENQKEGVLRNIWIKSKDQKGKKDIRRKVDIYIFPFVDKCNNCNKELGRFALHLLIDKNDEIKNKLNMINGKVVVGVAKVEDVNDILNPAFVVKQVDGGHIDQVNEAFRILTQLNNSEIKNSCYELFKGYQWQGRNNYVKVCRRKCKFRTGKIKDVTVLRNIWIKSKHQGKDIRRRVDIFILPFVSNDSNYALHILIDKKGVHDNKYFEKEHVQKRKRKTTHTIVSTTAGA